METPTNASWLNPIETHFNDMQRIALSGTDFRSWNEMDAALQKAIKYKNENRKEILDAQERRRHRSDVLKSDLYDHGDCVKTRYYLHRNN
ncbi:MAG: hypothetical protein KHF84_07335 [Thermoplasmata archaeon]|nr:hypothetical protein [Candidatus Sysuiplasma jiujiangense]